MTLDELAKNPDLLAGLPRESVLHLYQQAARLEADLRARLFAGPKEPTGEAGDKLLSVEAAAQRLGCSEDWIYRHQDELPVVRLGRHVKLSAVGLDAYIRRRLGRRP